MAKQPFGGRPSKTALARIKLTTGIVSVVTFVSSLGVIAYLSPGTQNAAGTINHTAMVGSTTSAGTTTAQNSITTSRFTDRQQTSITPLTRTRGS